MSLPILSGSRGKNSGLFIEANGRGTNSSFACNFAYPHLGSQKERMLDLKCALRITIFPSGLARPFEEGRKYGNAIVPTIAACSQNSDVGCFQQCLVVHRRVRHRPPWIVEVHALLSGSGGVCVGSCCWLNHRHRDLAGLPPKQHSSRMSRENALGGRMALATGV